MNLVVPIPLVKVSHRYDGADLICLNSFGETVECAPNNFKDLKKCPLCGGDIHGHTEVVLVHHKCTNGTFYCETVGLLYPYAETDGAPPINFCSGCGEKIKKPAFNEKQETLPFYDGFCDRNYHGN